MNTLCIGRRLVELDCVDSTNNYAQELLKRGVTEDGTLVWAHEQYKGRGQRDAQWVSKKDQNFTGSFILHPKLSVTDHFYLTKLAALSVFELVRSLLGEPFKDRVFVKWPNDIMVDSKKVAGILIENTIRGNIIETSVVGIGLNLNQQDFGNDLVHASSVGKIKGEEIDLRFCLAALCKHLEVQYIKLVQQKFELLDQLYHQALFRRDLLTLFESEQGAFEGKIRGVERDGLLAIETTDGDLQRFDLKTVRLILEAEGEKGL